MKTAKWFNTIVLRLNVDSCVGKYAVSYRYSQWFVVDYWITLLLLAINVVEFLNVHL